jgi:hypothetical protein
MKKVLFVVCVIAVLAIPVPGRSLSFQIDTLLTGTAPTSAPGWLELTFTNAASGHVSFTITSSLEVSSEFISDVVFNVDPLLTPSLVNFGSPPISKTGTFTNPTITKTTPNMQTLTPGVNFDIALAFKTANAQRFNGTDSITWDLTYGGPLPLGVVFNADSFNFFNIDSNPEKSGFYFLAHFQGIPTGQGSGKLGDKVNGVPEPSTLLLLGAGLVGFGILGRRKFRI